MSYCSYTNCTHCDTSMINLTGLCVSSDISEIIKNNPYWIQTFIPEILSVPQLQPAISSITDLDIDITTLRLQVVRTPVLADTNLEDKLVTGRTIVFEGEAEETIVYIADEPLNPFHSIKFYVPFTSYIVVPEEITFINSSGDTVTADSLDISFKIDACVKYIDICLIDNKTLRTNILVLFYAVPQDN